MSPQNTTSLEKESLEAHVDLCAIRYETLQNKFENVDKRLEKIEEKMEDLHDILQKKDRSLAKVIIGASGTIVATLLSTILVILMKLS